MLRGRQDAPTGATVVWYKGTVHLDAFEHGINADWIEPNVPSVNPSQPERTTSSGRRYIHQSVSDGDTSMFECERCNKAGSHRRTTDQYAGDLWLCPSCGYKTGRYDKL